MSESLTPAEAGDRYATWIARTGFADTTKRLYPQRVRAFLTWLEERWDEYDGALTDEHVRDYAVRDYRRELMTVDKRAVATVELAMSAIGSFYDQLGLGKPRIPRSSPPKGSPKSLDEKELRSVLRAAQRRGPRDFALTSLLFLTAVRVSEAAALDTDDVWITDRAGRIDVRHGKGGESRQVPVPADARAALRPWLAVRRSIYGDQVGPLFVSRTAGRLSVRRMQSLMADVGTDAGVKVTPHVLRHTYARAFLDSGGDVASLQEVLGHKNLSSTQVYTRPTAGRLADLAENVRMDV